MTYNEAIESIRENPFNLGKVPKNLIDIKLMRFTRRKHLGAGAWAVEGYGNSLKHNIEVWCDYVCQIEDIDI